MTCRGSSPDLSLRTLGGTRPFPLRVFITISVVAGCAATAGHPPWAAPDEVHRSRSIARAEVPARPSTQPGTTVRRTESANGLDRPGPAKGAHAASPTPGVYHPLARGTTLCMLSKEYGVSVETLMAVNGIVDPTSIPAGERIFVPGATRVLPVKPQAAVSSRFAWPLSGCITSPYGASDTRTHHTGIDIDGEEGDPIRAAAEGRVVRIEDNPQYGLLVVLGHGGGYETLYAHASNLLVGAGDWVGRGEVIALVGMSGNAHGTHLHFEVRRDGEPVDPIPFMEVGRIALAARGKDGAERPAPRPPS